MSCVKGKPCHEGLLRRRALAALGLMGVIFVALSAASFVDSRGQVVPQDIHYAGFDAVQGKRVFQAFNCMGCHTILGNGAYFAPDLTKLYAAAGPAWIEAFLPSAGAWPTRGAVALKLRDAEVAKAAGVDTIEAYLRKYPGAAERIARRGGQPTLMPNLPINQDDTRQLVAFLDYLSSLNTEGWPPRPDVNGLTFAQATPMPVSASAAQASATQASAAQAAAPDAGAGASSPAALGKELATDNGCTACHSAGTDKLVGPGWGGLYGATVELADGSSVKADDAYIVQSILEPDARIPAGFEPGVMPSFADILDKDQVTAIVAYIRSLGGSK